MKRKVATLLISSLLMTPVQSFADTSGVEPTTYEVQINKENSTKESNKGINPDSFFYVLDKLAENIKVTLTFDSVKKANLFLAIAEERLGESYSMIVKSKNDLAEKALKEYQSTLDNAINTTNEAMENGKEVSNITKEIEDVTLSQREIIEKILNKLKDEIKDTVQEELEKTYIKAEATKDVVSLVEVTDKENDEEIDKNINQEIDDKKDEEESSPENVVIEVIIKEEIKDEAIIEKAKEEKLNSRQLIAIISLAQQSGKSLEEVIDVFKDNGKGLGSTAIALNLAPKDALRGINDTFREYKSQVKAIIKSNGGSFTLEQLEEINKEIVGEDKTDSTETDSLKAGNQESNNQEAKNQNADKKGTLIIINEEQDTKDNDKYSRIINLDVKTKEAVKQTKGKFTDDKVIKEIEKAEKKINKTIKKAEEKIKKFEAKNKAKEVKKENKGKGNGKGWGNVRKNK